MNVKYAIILASGLSSTVAVMSQAAPLTNGDIELIAFMETWLAGLCFVVGIKWLIGLSIALFAIPLWGLISHRRWCRAHNEPYANWELFYTVIAWIVYIFITLVIYFHFFT